MLYCMPSQGRFLFFSSFWRGPGQVTPALCVYQPPRIAHGPFRLPERLNE
jgi:hypothetical protein